MTAIRPFRIEFDSPRPNRVVQIVYVHYQKFKRQWLFLGHGSGISEIEKGVKTMAVVTKDMGCL
jgi:hypothetical protein